MSALPTPIRFYLGANTPDGFVGYLDDLYDSDGSWRAYLIKSGPGTGKNTLMRTLLQQMLDVGYEPEAICCSSDPDSLDGVVLHEKKVTVLDATAPHICEPHVWGAVERIVNLSACMDSERLHGQAAELIALTRENTALHARGRRFLAAASTLLEENRRIATRCVDKGKVLRLAGRIATQELRNIPRQSGREWKRFLSAVTPQGILTFHSTVQALCPRIYAVQDEHGAAAAVLMEAWRAAALSAGLDVYTCRCPLSPARIEHILIPAIGVAFVHSNPWHTVDYPVFRRIHAARFTDETALRCHRQLLRFNRKTAGELCAQAVLCAQKAKAVHDQMEAFSAAAMDWDRAAALTAHLAAEWLDLPEA